MTGRAAFAYEVRGEAARRNRHLPAAAENFEAKLRAVLWGMSRSPEAAREALAPLKESG